MRYVMIASIVFGLANCGLGQDAVSEKAAVEPTQVMIEATLVEVTLDKDAEHGVDLASIDNAVRTVSFTEKDAATDERIAAVLPSLSTAVGQSAEEPLGRSNEMKIGILETGTAKFLERLGKDYQTKVLASSRLLILDKQQAEIHIGGRLVYRKTTDAPTSTIAEAEHVDIGTTLLCRPFVQPDGAIRLEVHTERTTGELDDQGAPQTETCQMSANVTIPEGKTMVIGGPIHTEVVKYWDGKPFLSRIPYVGCLFRHAVEESRQKELLLVLTSHVVRPGIVVAANTDATPGLLEIEPLGGAK